MKANRQVIAITVLNTAVVIYLKLSNVYNSIIIDVDCFVAYWFLVAFI